MGLGSFGKFLPTSPEFAGLSVATLRRHRGRSLNCLPHDAIRVFASTLSPDRSGLSPRRPGSATSARRLPRLTYPRFPINSRVHRARQRAPAPADRGTFVLVTRAPGALPELDRTSLT